MNRQFHVATSDAVGTAVGGKARNRTEFREERHGYAQDGRRKRGHASKKSRESKGRIGNDGGTRADEKMLLDRHRHDAVSKSLCRNTIRAEAHDSG
jgi:hypothetical protein